MQPALRVERIEKASEGNLFLICARDGEKASWQYLLAKPSHAGMLMGISAVLPLKLKLEEYGRIVFQGDGEAPPAYICNNIALADLAENIPDNYTEVFCFLSRDGAGERFYTYLAVPYFLVEKFKKISSGGMPFEFTNYGEIIHSGWGTPTLQTAQEMKALHDIETPEEMIEAA